MPRFRLRVHRLANVVLVTFGVALLPGPAQARQVVLVASDVGVDGIPAHGISPTSPGHVGAYDAVTGATVNANFIPAIGGGEHRLALDGHNHVFVSNSADNTVGEYDATTGATINAAFINGQGLNQPLGMVVDANNRLFVVNSGNSTVGAYNATTGATINARFVNGTGAAFPTGIALDGANHLLVLNNGAGPGLVVRYDATTGAQLLPFPFVPNLASPTKSPWMA